MLRHGRRVSMLALCAGSLLAAKVRFTPRLRRAFASPGKFLRSVQPPLDGSSYKGQNARLAIMGGSKDYTGAPYYAGMAALRTGAELVYVLTEDVAALPIKCYSPELMVTPLYRELEDGHIQLDWAQFLERVEKLHALVLGCGMGTRPELLQRASEICQKATDLGLPLVVDADGMEVIRRWPEVVRGAERAVLTPNVAEFRRLCETLEVGDQPVEKQLVELCGRLQGPCVLLKGAEDLICDREGRLARCTVTGTPRRSGGYGDVLAGSLGTILAWAGRRHEGPFPAVEAAQAACAVVRRACLLAFERKRRAMTAPDVLEEIGPAFEYFSDSTDESG